MHYICANLCRKWIIGNKHFWWFKMGLESSESNTRHCLRPCCYLRTNTKTKKPNRPATFPQNSMAVLHNAAGEHTHPHTDTRAHTENRRRHRARPWRTQCLTQSRRLVMNSRFSLASHKILRPECLLCFAGSSHSVNNGSVSEWRCRQCAVGPTIQSLTHSSHRAILLFYVPEAKSYLSPAERVGVSICLSVGTSAHRSLG